MSPFYANYGYHPRTNWPKEPPVKNPASTNYAHWLKETHDQVTETLKKTRATMGKYHDQKRKEAPAFKVGDKVMLDARNIKTRRPTKKFDRKYEGPFEIEAIMPHGTACRLKLPPEWKIHPTFHVSLLEPYRSSTIPGRPEPEAEEVRLEAEPVEEQEEETVIEDGYTPEKILSSKKEDGVVRYLVQWKGYPDPKDRTWEPFEHIKDFLSLVLEFHQQHTRRPKDPAVRKRQEAGQC